MEDQYEMADLRHYAGGRAFLHATAQPPDFPPTHPYYLLNFCPDNHAGIIAPPGAAIASADAGGCLITAAGFGTEVGGDSGAGRWPRQETLTLLEIRSRLDARFKEANQKGPLWDEVSRIMYDEYGYQRSGKKCKEKFENLYKYYKKTKGGKAGRQDGKHYRFFRQLEALYGDQTGTNKNNYSSASISGQPDFSGPNFPKNTNPFRNINNNQESYQSLVSISNSSDFDTIITSEDDSTELDFLDTEVNDPKMAEKISKKRLKAKIKDSIDIQMKKMIEKQEAWMEKMMMTIDENEKERIFREEQWRKQDAERVEREQRLWAGEKAWILARDAALMEAFGKLTGKESRVSRQDDEFIVQSQNESPKIEWTNSNVATWDRMSDRFIKCGKKRMGPYQVGPVLEGHGPDHGVNSSLDNVSNDGCFRYFGDDNA